MPAGYTAHGTPDFPSGSPQSDDTKCANCHDPSIPTGGIGDFFAAHTEAAFDPSAVKLELAIVGVLHTKPSEKPEIVFTVKKNGADADIIASPLDGLSVTVAGPTTDYVGYKTYAIQASQLTKDAQGYHFTLPDDVTAIATQKFDQPTAPAGTFAFGLEGYIDYDNNFHTGRVAGGNPIFFAAVTDAAPVPRRKVVDAFQCNGCHLQLEAHGGARQDPQYCVFCHNSNRDNASRVPRFESSTVTAQPLDFPFMAHRIHAGAASYSGYLLGGYPGPTTSNPGGTPIDFSDVRYPGDLKSCPTCHAGASYLLPLPFEALAAKSETFTCSEDALADTNDYCDSPSWASTTKRTPPTQAACGGCHDKPYETAHMQTQTTPDGLEACATCHKPGAPYDAAPYHLPSP